MEGVIKFYNQEGSYGFIIRKKEDESIEEVFFKKDDCFDDPLFFKKGDKVCFNLLKTDRGKHAVHVMRVYKDYKKESLGVIRDYDI